MFPIRWKFLIYAVLIRQNIIEKPEIMCYTVWHVNVLLSLEFGMNPRKTNPSYQLLRLAALAVPLGLLAFLALITTRSADDYWYSTFWNQGLQHYLELMQEHYLTFNGRVLVHVFAQTVLHFGNGLFMVFCVGLTLLIPVLTARMAQEENRPAIWLTAALFCAGVMLLPQEFFTIAYLWVSAFSNYVLPVSMIVLELLLLCRLSQAHRWAGYPVFLAGYVFLCGATTEQSGAAAVAIALCFAVEAVAFRRGWQLFVGSVLSALTGIAGLLTIFLSPATQLRADMEVADSLLAQFWEGLESEYAYFLEMLPLCLMLTVLFLVAGCWLWQKCGTKAGGILCILLAVLPPLLQSFPESYRAQAMLVMLVALAVCALLLFLRSQDRSPAYLLAAAVVSAGVILFTKSTASRTMLPSCLYLLAATARMMAGLVDERQMLGTFLSCCLSVTGAVITVPRLPYDWYNYQVEQENNRYIQQAQQTGVLYCNIDYDDAYTHSKMYTDGYFFQKYLEMAGMENHPDQVYLFSRDGYSVYLEGALYSIPAYEVDGTCYVYVRCLEALGATIDYTREETKVTLGDHTCFLGYGTVAYLAQDGMPVSFPLVQMEKFPLFTFLPEQIYTDVFGLKLDIDEDARIIQITQGESE